MLTSLLICLSCIACGGGSDNIPNTSSNTSGSIASSDSNVTPISADIKVLMMGNSHTHANSLPKRLEAMLRAGHPNKTVAVVVAPASLFLDEHSKYAPTLALLKGQTWNFVVLQAQKYSTSGMYSYSTSEAVTLINLARKAGALPVLFPEWARKGIPETDYIFNIHTSIAEQAPACIAPVGQTWDLVQQRHPELDLFSIDGNHSAGAGAQLTALMLYTTMSGKLPSSLPDISFPDVSQIEHRKLVQAADDAAMALSPRKYCPLDKLTLL
jgi:hypothetical protein